MIFINIMIIIVIIIIILILSLCLGDKASCVKLLLTNLSYSFILKRYPLWICDEYYTIDIYAQSSILILSSNALPLILSIFLQW